MANTQKDNQTSSLDSLLSLFNGLSTFASEQTQNFKESQVSKKVQKIYTPLDEAVQILKKRQHNQEIQRKVAAFLNNDIPEHFKVDGGIFYLSRYLATPNFEAIRVAEMTAEYPQPLVIGQDLKSKFTGNNELKRALGKLPILKGYSHNKDEIIEYFTIVDFSCNDGKKTIDVTTTFDEPLAEFHQFLFNEIFGTKAAVADETAWVDNHFRNDIYEQYKHMLALLCTHGIMLESFPPEEHIFAQQIVIPAFEEVTKLMGCRPLIVEHIPQELEVTRDWNAYPSAVYQYVKRKLPQ